MNRVDLHANQPKSKEAEMFFQETHLKEQSGSEDTAFRRQERASTRQRCMLIRDGARSRSS